MPQTGMLKMPLKMQSPLPMCSLNIKKSRVDIFRHRFKYGLQRKKNLAPLLPLLLPPRHSIDQLLTRLMSRMRLPWWRNKPLGLA